MATPPKSRWRIIRVWFRGFRIAVLLLILLVAGILVSLDQIGLPKFLERRLLDRLHAGGIDLQVSRIRWRWYHGIVAEDVRFGLANETRGPRLTAEQVNIHLDHDALIHFQVHVDSIALVRGRLSFPVGGTNSPADDLAVDHIQTELRLLPDDVWQLANFQARFADANIQLTGTVTNASAIRGWTFVHEHQPSGARQKRLKAIADSVGAIRFSTPPDLFVDVRGDARDLQSFKARLLLNSGGAQTPWGNLSESLLTVRVFPATNDLLAHAEIKLEAKDARTEWVSARTLNLTALLQSVDGGTNFSGHLDLTATNLESKWAGAAALRGTANWVHSFTNGVPLSGQCDLHFDAPETKWGRAAEANISVALGYPTNAPSARSDDSWSWWSTLLPFGLDAQCRVAGVDSPKIKADDASFAVQWRAPDLSLSQFSAHLYGGSLQVTGNVDVATRRCAFGVDSDFDAQQIASLLGGGAQHWMSQFAWQKAPVVQASGSLRLPPWLERHPDWERTVQPSVNLAGRFHVENGAFRGVHADSADSHFAFSNMVWRLPDLVATRPEGRLDIVHESDEARHEFYFHVHSNIDPAALKPLLETNGIRMSELVAFSQAPVVDGEVWGRWHEVEHLHGHAMVSATNFVLRGVKVSAFQSEVQYTNLQVLLVAPRAEMGTNRASATAVGLDFIAQKVNLTNAAGTAELRAVAQMIGPKTARAMEPYHFMTPPTVRVYGVVPMRGNAGADLHVQVINGGPFEWWKYRTPRITGQIVWLGDHLLLQDVHADCYGGEGTGAADFDFRPAKGTDFQFSALVTNADVHMWMADVVPGTNRLEGLLTAWVQVTHANSDDWQQTQGRGGVRLHDGLIWEIPVFGVLSPALDAILPGLGKSRAGEASATFVITNGVIDSEDLEIQAWIARLRYNGTVDLQGRLDARVTAELLRNTWFIGPLMSVALWPVSKMFEYKVTGTLKDPKSQPVYIPKIFLLPFHPLKTLKELVPTETSPPGTNAPVFAPVPPN